MTARRATLPTLAILALLAGLPPAAVAGAKGSGAGEAVTVAVAPFTYLDTSGEPGDQAAAHSRRLDTLMAGLARDLASDHRFSIVALSCEPDACADALDDAAAAEGARLVVVGGIHKLSTLVQWAKVQLVDTGTGGVVFDRLYTFRGDDDRAWRRAGRFMVDDLLVALPAAITDPPVPLAVFDFRLEDASAGASTSGVDTADRAALAALTKEVRDVLAASGRYRLVDPGAAATDGATCDGCETAIADRLGADQLFTGVVRRISRTEYEVRFRVRDSASGAVLASADSGLRLGADYSWGRGAARLVRERLLGE